MVILKAIIEKKLTKKHKRQTITIKLMKIGLLIKCKLIFLIHTSCVLRHFYLETEIYPIHNDVVTVF